MDTAKEEYLLKITKIVLYLFFILFPFGQLLKISVSLLDIPIRVQLIDIVVGLSIPIYFLNRQDKHLPFKYLRNFIYAAGFSLLISGTLFPLSYLSVGIFYYLRLIAYFYFLILVWNLINLKKSKEGNNFRKRLLKIILFTITTVSLIGWLQYFFLNDLRFLKVLGWDDHLGRLTGSFLDPAFIGLIIVFGVIISLWFFIRSHKKIYLILSLLQIVTLFFTYSRASYLALIVGLCSLMLIEHRKKLVLTLILLIILFVPFLPRPSSEGVKLERLFSVLSRIDNYRQTSIIALNNPLFGVGYNNICLARGLYFNELFFDSHSCSGSDSSLLFILATTGIVGFLIFIVALTKILKSIQKKYQSLIWAIVASLTAHSLFSNSLFYPWILGLFFILLALTNEKNYEV